MKTMTNTKEHNYTLINTITRERKHVRCVLLKEEERYIYVHYKTHSEMYPRNEYELLKGVN